MPGNLLFVRLLTLRLRVRSEDHCSRRMLFSRTMGDHFCNSDWTFLARTSWLPPTASTPSFCNVSFTRGDARTALVLMFRISTIAVGVPAEANSPNHPVVS